MLATTDRSGPAEFGNANLPGTQNGTNDMKAMHQKRINLLGHLTAGVLGAGLVLGSLTGTAAPKAQNPKNDLAISLTARKVVKLADGKERLQPADRAFPGEVIQYDALYLNQSEGSLNNVSPTLPIPTGMVLVPESASPTPTEASLDGRTFERIPLKRKVRLPNGEEKEEVVPATEYRALRWHVGDMAAGAKTTVSARTRLIPANP